MIIFSTMMLAHELTPKQIAVLQTVRDVAKSIPDKNGKTYENTLSAICLTESSAGRDNIGDVKNKKHYTKGSFGAMQIQLRTARAICAQNENLKWLNNLNDLQLAGRLLGDIKLSAQIAAYYLVYLQNSRRDHFYAVSGYNGGYTNHKYYNKVMNNKKIIKNLVNNGKLS